MNGGLIIKRLSNEDSIIIERDNFDMQVDDVKRIINDRFGIPIDRQLLIFKGKLLEDGRNLSEYRIMKDDTINLVIRLVSRAESPDSRNTRFFLESQRQ
jgi:hypothetical protein